MPGEVSYNLSMPLMMPAQAQKHITHNEALMVLDALVQLSVISKSQSSPPAAPSNGDRYIVPVGAASQWKGPENSIASFSNNGWVFYTPQAGWLVWVSQGNEGLIWQDNAWKPSGIASSKKDMLGINATANSTNRLAVSSSATLLSHEGNSHQLKINKSASQHTASLLFQSNLSGRAEMGLAGNNNFSIKVSSNGQTWSEPFKIDSANQKVEINGYVTGSAITQSSTDITANRLTKVGDFGIGKAINLTQETEFKSLNLAMGFYTYKPQNLTGAPETGAQYHNLLTMLAPDSVTGENNQRCFISVRTPDGSTNMAAWIGSQSEDNAPVKWQNLYSSTSIIGTVSQQNGVPSGAILEKGSTSKGTYIRFADGTQICHTTLSSSTSAGTRWIFPKQFSIAPTISATARSNLCAVAVEDAQPTKESATVSVRGADNSRLSTPLSLMAIGRWF